MIMERKAMKLAACFFLLTVLLRGVSVDACLEEDQLCDPKNPDCCEGLECVEVSPNEFKCEPACCEEHADHDCKVHERECCDDENTFELTCDCDVDVGNCTTYTNKLREECDPSKAICARRAECVDLDGDGTYHCQCRQKGTKCEDDCDCCVNAVCTLLSDETKECRCNKKEDDPCDPNACVPECCHRECVQVAVGDFRCKAV